MAWLGFIFHGIVVVAVLAFSSLHVSAQMYCAQPDPPTCHRHMMQSSQSWQFDDFRMKIIRFQAELHKTSPDLVSPWSSHHMGNNDPASFSRDGPSHGQERWGVTWRKNPWREPTLDRYSPEGGAATGRREEKP